MSLPRRRVGTIALSLALTATMVAGLGFGVAQASDFDKAEKPLNVDTPSFFMTVEESQHIASQLEPISLRLKLKKSPHPAVAEWVQPIFPDDPFMKDDAWKYVRKGYQQGQIIRQRKSLWSQLFFPGSRSVQYAFVSYDSRGYPMTATATLVVPLHAKENAGVVQYNQFINSSGPRCKVTNSLNSPLAGGDFNNVIQGLNIVLAAGHPVLFPDAEGPRNSYAINRLASHVLLDSMRMVHRQKDFPLKSSPFTAIGISHGGMQTGYAAAEQPYYAPDLTKYIKQFIVNEGAPDLIKVAHNFGFFGSRQNIPALYGSFMMSFVIGAMREYSDVVPNAEKWLTDYGKSIITVNRNLCMPFTFPMGTGMISSKVMKDGFFESETFRQAMQVAKESSSIYYPGHPKVPTLLIHGALDEILFQAEQDAVLWHRYCDAGSNMLFQLTPVGHFGTPALSMPRMLIQGMAPFHGAEQHPNCDIPVLL